MHQNYHYILYIIYSKNHQSPRDRGRTEAELEINSDRDPSLREEMPLARVASKCSYLRQNLNLNGPGVQDVAF